jgi:hypothetical protein
MSVREKTTLEAPPQLWGCALCNVPCVVTAAQIAEHSVARRHLQAARSSGDWGCLLCRRALQGEEEFLRHLQGCPRKKGCGGHLLQRRRRCHGVWIQAPGAQSTGYAAPQPTFEERGTTACEVDMRCA